MTEDSTDDTINQPALIFDNGMISEHVSRR